ncbi:hypothetical protein C8R44DRAFT_745419 [Mycena epipterygia]|nr:hypothetical protein C8R44DRAFT_745419 [Mycena epipterygia]
MIISGMSLILGLIRWGIVIYGFIDGYSRLITGLLASNNNRGQTVLDLFLAAGILYEIPSRLQEHLWADITAQIGATWADLFTILEINDQLRFFMESWNHHQLRIRDGPNRSPAYIFGFDMMRGTDPMVEQPMSEEEMEVFGVDWEEALHDDDVLDSRQDNNPPNEGSSS